MTIIISLQSSRSISGTTSIALTLAYLLGTKGRTLYIEGDFLNPTLSQIMHTSNFRKYSNDWIIGEASLNDSCVEVNDRSRLPPMNLYVVAANDLDDARRRMEVLDIQRDKRLLSTLENEKWMVGGKPLDYVIIDTSALLNYLLATVSYVSNYLVYVIKPNTYELAILEDRIKKIYSKFVCVVRPIVNFYQPGDENAKNFERIFIKRIGIEPVKIPYIPELKEGIDLTRLFNKNNRLQNYLVEIMDEIIKKPEISSESI
ncbi:MAG: ParA family protein [Aigarchaeota archaeon]|nr:ParA family protein [Aigarchaeota archaeon]MCX8193352.1 ParA family protein [Nitrososphaeria archaeon]MDW7985882.1 ParA family protein [Nitrososphaerota archaeon]